MSLYRAFAWPFIRNVDPEAAHKLTLNLLPNAHAVLFLLSADAGVTKTDLEVWNHHLAGEDAATKAARGAIRGFRR